MSDFKELMNEMLNFIDAVGFTDEGAYNLRYNGSSYAHENSEHIRIVHKEQGLGLDIYIDGNCDGEEVHIPVIVDRSGLREKVLNDFHIEDGAKATIAAGCGIHNCGDEDSQHDGVHTFYIGKNCDITYSENHYGDGDGTGARILNPVTNVYVGENSVFTLDTAQIKGVSSTNRQTHVELEDKAKLYVVEKLMTHEDQLAESNIDVELKGEGSSAKIVSRAVAKESSRQVFHPAAIGKSKCNAHIQCDAIIMDDAKVRSIPEIDAQNLNAAIIHEAAIGRINDEQVLKLRTLGLTEDDAEAVIIDNFLN
jgi:hypothetical protein